MLQERTVWRNAIWKVLYFDDTECPMNIVIDTRMPRLVSNNRVQPERFASIPSAIKKKKKKKIIRKQRSRDGWVTLI